MICFSNDLPKDDDDDDDDDADDYDNGFDGGDTWKSCSQAARSLCDVHRIIHPQDNISDKKNEKIYLVMVGLLYSTMEELWTKMMTWSDEVVVVFTICDSLCTCG